MTQGKVMTQVFPSAFEIHSLVKKQHTQKQRTIFTPCPCGQFLKLPIHRPGQRKHHKRKYKPSASSRTAGSGSCVVMMSKYFYVLYFVSR